MSRWGSTWAWMIEIKTLKNGRWLGSKQVFAVKSDAEHHAQELRDINDPTRVLFRARRWVPADRSLKTRKK